MISSMTMAADKIAMLYRINRNKANADKLQWDRIRIRDTIPGGGRYVPVRRSYDGS